MAQALYSTLKVTRRESGHCQCPEHTVNIWSEYGIQRVTWRSGRITYHLTAVRMTECGGITVTDPWDNCQWGETDSRELAHRMGLNWPV